MAGTRRVRLFGGRVAWEAIKNRSSLSDGFLDYSGLSRSRFQLFDTDRCFLIRPAVGNLSGSIIRFNTVWQHLLTYPNGSAIGVPRWKTGYRFWEPGFNEGECAVKRLQKNESTQGQEVGLPPDEFLLQNCPTLLDYMTNTKYDDGGVRNVSTLTIFVDGGMFKVSVNDRDAEASLYASAGSLQDALIAAESRLNTANNDWRFWGKNKKKK